MRSEKDPHASSVDQLDDESPRLDTSRRLPVRKRKIGHTNERSGNRAARNRRIDSAQGQMMAADDSNEILPTATRMN